MSIAIQMKIPVKCMPVTRKTISAMFRKLTRVILFPECTGILYAQTCQKKPSSKLTEKQAARNPQRQKAKCYLNFLEVYLIRTSMCIRKA